MAEPRCPICHAVSSAAMYRGLQRCRNCTHVWADLTLDWDAARALYRREYFFGEEYSNYLQDRPVIEKNFARRAAVLDRFLTPAHARLYEIGCAYGFFLNAMRDRFDTVGGIDVSEEAIAFAAGQGLDVTGGDFLTAELGDRGFDVLCLWDTIEHLPDPRAYLARAATRMPRGGLLAFTTGDIGSVTARVQRGRWRLIHPPSHLQYFTRASAAEVVQRCGFRVVHFEHCGFSRSASGMVQNLVALRWGHPRLASALVALVPPRLDIYLNLHDIMFVIAERC